MTVQGIEAASDYVCSWATDICCDPLATALASNDAATVRMAQRAVTAAAEILYALSGRQFGLCELTVRPCRTECCDPCNQSGPRWTPALIGGQWTNVSCGDCGDGCSCSKVCEVALPGPIDSIVEVKLDGVVLAADQYRVDNRRTLVRLTEGECWPTCQEMSLDSSQPGTWEVTYYRGLPLPEAGEASFAELACELYKACANDGTCKLPKRVTSIQRDGVTMAFLDPMTFIEKGKTGLYLVDLWLTAVNPKARVRRAGIYSPDLPTTRRTTWP